VTVLLLCCAALAQAAPSPAPSSSKPTASARSAGGRKAPQPKPDEGSLTKGTYTEKFFSLSYALPANWVVRTPEIRQGLAAQDNAVLLLSAFGKDKPAVSEINPSVTLSAESLSSYPDVKTAEDYFAVLSQVVTSKGFVVLNAPAEIDVGGVTFLRGDFQKQEDDSTTYQATMVALRKDYLLTITAISGNEEDLTPLLNRLQIFAPPTLNRR